MEDPSVIAPAALQSTPCADAPWGGWLHAIETQVKHFDGKTSKTVYTHQVPIEGLAVSAIGDNLVVVSINDSVGEVFYWKMAPANTDPRYTHINNANTAWAEINPVKVPLESRARVTAIAWIRQDLISVGHADGDISLYDRTDNASHLVRTEGGEITALATLSRERLAVGFRSGSIRIVDTFPRVVLGQVLHGPEQPSPVISLAGHDGPHREAYDFLLIQRYGMHVELWKHSKSVEGDTPKRVRCLERGIQATGGPCLVGWAAGGRAVVVTNSKLHVWDVRSGTKKLRSTELPRIVGVAIGFGGILFRADVDGMGYDDALPTAP